MAFVLSPIMNAPLSVDTRYNGPEESGGGGQAFADPQVDLNFNHPLTLKKNNSRSACRRNESIGETIMN